LNKKLTNILRTNVTLYFICLVLFALAAIPFDVRLAIGEGAAAVVLLIIARRRSRSVQQSMRQYMDRFTGGMDSARSSNMLFAPLPMMVFDMDTQAVVWCNDGFLALTEQKEGVFDAHLNAVVPTFSVRWLMEGKNECPEHVVWNHRIYRVYGGLTRPTPDTPATMATTYWMDVTDSEQLRQTLQMTRPVVAILMVDNYEDLMKACPESKRSAVLAQLEEKLDQWSAGADGLMLHYDRDRYLFVFEERSYSDYAQHRFAVLDTVREVAAGGGAGAPAPAVADDGVLAVLRVDALQLVGHEGQCLIPADALPLVLAAQLAVSVLAAARLSALALHGVLDAVGVVHLLAQGAPAQAAALLGAVETVRMGVVGLLAHHDAVHHVPHVQAHLVAVLVAVNGHPLARIS